jgi:uncharacterized protein (DUF2336 family)
MSATDTRPWWPRSPDAAAHLAHRLKDDAQPQQLFEFLCVAAAEQEWSLFTAAMADLCGLKQRGVRNILGNTKFEAGLSLLYGSTGLAPELYPLFVEILKTARRLPGSSAEPRTRRTAIIQQVLSSAALRGVKVTADLRAALLR